jgi:hypothetical protein
MIFMAQLFHLEIKREIPSIGIIDEISLASSKLQG